jgi:hypothetical protein
MYTDGDSLTTEGSVTIMHTILPPTTLTEYEQWLLETLPRQGSWTVEEYLWITERSDGRV